MNELNLNISSFSNDPSNSILQFRHPWIFPLFILSIFGILFTIIILFFFLYFSIRRLNDHLYLPNLLICFSVFLLYIIVIVFFVRPNEFYCGLREFLSQIVYVLLFSALLCRYIMQWLSTRILSERTKQWTTLLIYSLLISTQIPIGILWWYFTIPKFCENPLVRKSPKFKFHFESAMSTKPSCSYQCTADYRFYATYTYIIVELFLCTIIGICLFFYRCCHRTFNGHDRSIKTIGNHQTLASFINMFALILIDIVWLFWTLIYYFTNANFLFPTLVMGMFAIATISLLFILLPQVYFYSKNQIKEENIPKILLFSNKLASIDDVKDQEDFKQKERLNYNKQQMVYNDSELSYELGASGTFLPITRTPKGLFKAMAATPIEKLNQLIYEKQSNTSGIGNKPNRSMKYEEKRNRSGADLTKGQPAIEPLQSQYTSSSVATDLVDPKPYPPSTSMYYSPYVSPYHDETLIPILCSSEHQPTSTPVQMRILVKSPSSSVPTTRRFYSGADHRYLQPHPYEHFPPSTAPVYYPSPLQQSYRLANPYRTMPSGLPFFHRYPYSYRRFHTDNRSLSERLWNIESDDDDQDDINRNRFPSIRGRAQDYRSTNTETVGDEDEEEEEEEVFYNNQKPAFM